VDTQTLGWIKDDYEAYMTAYNDFPRDNVIGTTHSSIEDWLDAVVTIWQNGLGDDVDAAYKLTTHNDLLKSVGYTVTDGQEHLTMGRKALLKAWKFQESPYHWGSNTAKANGSAYQATPYRMAEGGADEFGSLSFSQVLYKYRYSDKPCTVFNNNNTNLNFYNPVDNLKAFAVYTSMNATSVVGEENCDNGPFKKAFIDKSFDKSYESSLSDLIGYKQNGATLKLYTSETKKDDTYEILSKAIGVYNGASTKFGEHSWPYLIKTNHLPPIEDDPTTKDINETITNAGNICFSCGYTLKIKNQRFGLPYREYIWAGKRGVDLDGDGIVGDNPATTEDESPELSAPVWCFAYGEKEWVEGEMFEKIKSRARGTALKPAVGRIDCTTGESI